MQQKNTGIDAPTALSTDGTNGTRSKRRQVKTATHNFKPGQNGDNN